MRRRIFMQKAAAAAAAAIAAPTIIPASAIGAAGRPAPSGRITLGAIGMGGQGRYDLSALMQLPQVQTLAVCDVDMVRAREAAQYVARYAEEAGRTDMAGECMVTRHHEEILQRPDVDAVLVASPDHWHAVHTIAAMRQGKDVYCEKPLSYSVAEGRAMVDAAHRYGRVVQTGTQRRSMELCLRVCELVRNGRLGRLKAVRVGLPKGFYIVGDYEGIQPPQTPPDHLDYDRWLGPAPWAPYTPGRCHFNFRWILDYSPGYISDWGAHYLDVAQLALGADDTGPVEISGSATFPSDGLYDAPIAFEIDYRYADGVRMIASTEERLGVLFEGEEGSIMFEPEASPVVEANPPTVMTSVIGPGEIHLRRNAGHHADFIDAVMKRSVPSAPIEVGHRSATVCQLGMIACQVGRPLRWDPVREEILDDEEATGRLWRPLRAPWRL